MITLTEEQARQIEEALASCETGKWDATYDEILVEEALSTIRAAKAQEQAEQEPVANTDCPEGLEYGLYGFAMPAPVHTKDLTDEECVDVYTAAYNRKESALGICRAVIAADREKNCA